MCAVLAAPLSSGVAATSVEDIDTSAAPSLSSRLGAIAGAVSDTAERNIILPSRQAAEAVFAHPRTRAVFRNLGETALSLGALADSHVMQPVSREASDLLTRWRSSQSYEWVSAILGGLLDRLRDAVLDPLVAALHEETGRINAPLPAPAHPTPRLTTAIDPLAQGLVIPGLPDSDILRNLNGDDPLEPFNRLMFRLNGGLQTKVLAPVSRFYADETSPDVQLAVGNFFRNLREPATIVSSAFEGQLDDAGTAAARFVINSTLGIAGLRDPATKLGYVVRPRNFEETLCTYRLPSGPFLVLPILGPATLRDAAGRIATVVMYFEVMGSSVYIPYRISDFTVQYALVKDKLDLINGLSTDPYTAQKALYLSMLSLGCGQQASIHREFFAR